MQPSKVKPSKILKVTPEDYSRRLFFEHFKPDFPLTKTSKHLSTLSTFFLLFRYKANVFSSKREKTYEMLLQDMYDKYWSHGSTDYSEGGRTNSGSIKLYGHQRKAQEQIVSLSLFDYAFHRANNSFPNSRIHLSKWAKLSV